MPDITDMADWVSERRIPQPADGEPAITMYMDDDRIIFRDQAALDAYVADVIGRAVASRNELTKAEASKLIEALAAEVDKKNAAGEVQG